MVFDFEVCSCFRFNSNYNFRRLKI
jgi:hypothetical protein